MIELTPPLGPRPLLLLCFVRGQRSCLHCPCPHCIVEPGPLLCRDFGTWGHIKAGRAVAVSAVLLVLLHRHSCLVALLPGHSHWFLCGGGLLLCAPLLLSLEFEQCQLVLDVSVQQRHCFVRQDAGAPLVCLPGASAATAECRYNCR